MIWKSIVAGLLLLLVLGLGAPTAQTAPVFQESSAVLYLPLITYNTVKPAVAFATNRDGNFEIYAVNPNTGAQRNVTMRPGVDDMAPAFGPGGRLTWASNGDGNWEIYSGNVLGHNFRRLTFDANIDYSPTWSPDGQRIAFSSDRSGNMDVWDIKADGTELRRLTDHPSQQRQPAYSPDGNQIAYVSDQDGKDNF